MTSRTRRAARATVVGASAEPGAALVAPAVPATGGAEAGFWGTSSSTPGEALRADLAASGLPEPLPEGEAARWDAWLQIATVLDRLRTVPRRRRAAYAAGTEPVWAVAREVSGEVRFDRVAAVMAAWPRGGEAPALPEFRELLWGVEQVEAAGGVRLALDGLAGLVRLVPAGDVRAGYALAQGGRALRTLGALDAADQAFHDAVGVANAHADGWLLCRCLLGQAALAHVRGNYPAARRAFAEVLERAPEAPELVVGAHHGLLSTAVTLRAFEQGLQHALAAMRLTTRDAESRRVTLCSLGTLCEEMGDARAARAAYDLALALGPRGHQRPFLIRRALQLSLLLEEGPAIDRYGALLETQLTCTYDPYERAACLQVLASLQQLRGEVDTARATALEALDIAEQRGFSEIDYTTRDFLAAVEGQRRHHRRRPALQAPSWTLDPDSRRLLDSLLAPPPSLACVTTPM